MAALGAAVRPHADVGLLGTADGLHDAGRIAQQRTELGRGDVVEIRDGNHVLTRCDDQCTEVEPADGMIDDPSRGLVQDSAGHGVSTRHDVTTQAAHNVWHAQILPRGIVVTPAAMADPDRGLEDPTMTLAASHRASRIGVRLDDGDIVKGMVSTPSVSRAILAAFASLLVACAAPRVAGRSAPEIYAATGHVMKYAVSLPARWTRDRAWPVVVVIPDATRDFAGNLAEFTTKGASTPFIFVAPHVVTSGGARGYRSAPGYRY